MACRQRQEVRRPAHEQRRPLRRGRQRLGAKDATNKFVTALSNYTPSTATTLSGDANVVTDVALASGGSVSSIRFNDPTVRTITITSGTLSAGGVLMTSSAGTGTIAGGSLKAAGAGGELVLVQNHPTNALNISSNIVDNGTSGLTTAGVGKTVLSGQNSYTGKTLIGSGTLQFAKRSRYTTIRRHPGRPKTSASPAAQHWV